jgi:lipoate---protein ligase
LMRLLDLTLPSAAENSALDEALLDEAETCLAPIETLRLWEPNQPAVVIGRSSRAENEVRLDACRELGVPVLRRPSGGAAIVTGPGCLMYALVLSYELRPSLRVLSNAHGWVLGVLARALGSHVPGVHCQGTSDLAVGDLKFSGNSVRCRRRSLLYHGTLLYDFPLALVTRLLKMPPRMPTYRGGRPHDGFLTNLPLGAEVIRGILIASFDAHEPYGPWPDERTRGLVAEKYSQPTWNLPLDAASL